MCSMFNTMSLLMGPNKHCYSLVLVKIKQNRYTVIEQQTIGTARKHKHQTHTVTYGVLGVYVLFSKTILGSSSFFIINKRCFTHQFFGPSFFSCSFSKIACHDLGITLFLRCFFTYVLTRYKLYCVVRHNTVILHGM